METSHEIEEITKRPIDMMNVEKYSNLGYSVGCTELDMLPKRMDLERFINYVGLTEAKELPVFLPDDFEGDTPQELNENNCINKHDITTTTNGLNEKSNEDITTEVDDDVLMIYDRQEVTDPTKTPSGSAMTQQLENTRDIQEETTRHSCTSPSTSSCFSHHCLCTMSGFTQTSMVPNVCPCEHKTRLYLEARVRCRNSALETTSNALLKSTSNTSDISTNTTTRHRSQQNHQASIPNAKTLLQNLWQLKSPPIIKQPPPSPSPPPPTTTTTTTTFTESTVNVPCLLSVVTSVASTLSVCRWIVLALFCSVAIPTGQSFHNGNYHLPPFNAAKGRSH